MFTSLSVLGGFERVCEDAQRAIFRASESEYCKKVKI